MVLHKYGQPISSNSNHVEILAVVALRQQYTCYIVNYRYTRNQIII